MLEEHMGEKHVGIRLYRDALVLWRDGPGFESIRT